MNILPLAAVAGIFFLFSQKKKTTSKAITTKPDVKPNDEVKETPSDEKFDDDIPDEINIQQNNENILKYYSPTSYYLTQIPDIYNDLVYALQVTYDPKQTPSYSQAFIYLKPDFASEIWEHARYLSDKADIADKPMTQALADPIVKEILENRAPDVYWGEGSLPYAYQSPFYYVWASTNFLTRLAWSAVRAEKGDTVGLVLPKSIG